MSTEGWVSLAVVAIQLLTAALATAVWQRIGRVEKKVDDFPEQLAKCHARISEARRELSDRITDGQVEIGKLQERANHAEKVVERLNDRIENS